jgi:hypothetical protein
MPATNGDGPSFFSRYIENPSEQPRQQLDEPEIIRRGPLGVSPLTHRSSSPTEKLLSWMVNHWSKSTITARDIRAYGPYCTRDLTEIMSRTKMLVQYGWLVPVRAWRRDMKKWRIVREPDKEIPAQV